MFAGWMVYVSLIVSYYLVFQNFDRDLFLIASVSIATFFLKVIFIKSYLQAQNKPRPIAIGSLVSRAISVTYLVVGTQLNFSFDRMMLYLPVQAFVFFLVMLLSRPDFLRLINLRHFRLRRLTESAHEAFPVFLSTVLYFFYNQSDILIMSHLLDANAVGMYSASIKLIPQAAFIGYVLVATFYKEMDKKLMGDRNAFNSYVRSLLSIQFGVAIMLACGVFLVSDLLIHLLYGARYTESARVLKIACWAWVFILPAALYSRILIMLGYAKYELIKMLIVAPIIVILNYLAILRIGMVGSAYVVVLSYFLVDFLVYFLFADTRHFGVIGVKALADIFIRPRKTILISISLLKAKA
jgi:O-antigen/teichoic acid export membrane protein